MKLFLDAEGKVDYDKITDGTTVGELLEAIDLFLEDNKLPCDICGESCCKKSWSVEIDNVCVNRLCGWDREAASNFIEEKLVMKENFFRGFFQYVLKKETNCCYVTESNLCTIYGQRPIICRLYICSPRSHRYNVVRELVGGTYLRALVIEEKIRRNHTTAEMLVQYRRNPAVFARDYDILIDDILYYAQEEGWLYPEETEELYREQPREGENAV